jgi:hypothetical protein
VIQTSRLPPSPCANACIEALLVSGPTFDRALDDPAGRVVEVDEHLAHSESVCEGHDPRVAIQLAVK